MKNINLIPILVLTIIVLSVFDLCIRTSDQTNGRKNNELSLDSSVRRQEIPRTIMLDPLVLVNAKKGLQDGNNMSLRVDINQLTIQADSFLHKKVTSVTDKRELPPSGDKHDFLSLAPYRWPDPAKKNGLPYIGREGLINPEIYTIPDKENLDEMIHILTVLSAAYYFTDNPTYASKAEELLRVWFLDNSTKMNPNLRYAEMVRGKDNVYSAGIMAGRNLTDVIDAVGLIQSSSAWTSEDQAGMKSWFSKYLNWLLNSRVGKEESQKMNNHGTYYYVQASDIALFLNKTNITRNIIESFVQEPTLSRFLAPELSIHVKIQPDGRQLFELQRNRALDYSMFNLLGVFKLANVAEHVEIDLWNYKVGEDPLLQKALDFLLPYITKKDSWPYSQVTEINRHLASDLLCQAIVHYPHRSGLYSQAYEDLGPNRSFIGIDNLLPCRS